MEHQCKENTLHLFTPTSMLSFAQHYFLSPYCIVFVVGLLQSNYLHHHLVREVSSSPFLTIYTFCYFKYIVLYMDCETNSNSGILDKQGIGSVSFRFSFLLSYNNRTCTCMYDMVMHLSIDGSTSYFAQP